MDARTNVLWASAPGTILPDQPTMLKTIPQREELLTLWKESSANLLKVYDFSDEEIEDLLEKEWNWTVVSQQWYFQTKKVQNMPNSTIHMLTKISRNLRPFLPLDDFFQLFLDKLQIRLS